LFYFDNTAAKNKIPPTVVKKKNKTKQLTTKNR